MPQLVRPMMATAGPLPSAAQDDRYAYEMKWDGVRAVVYLDDDLRVLTRNDRQVASSYPELRQLLGRTPPVVLDGEIVAISDRGRPDFGWLQQRMHVVSPSPALLRAVPVTLLLFDVLWLDGRSLVREPYTTRREVLEGLGLVGGPCWDTPPVFHGDGADALAVSRQADLEGVIAKRLECPYEPGRRSRNWTKIKHERMQEVVVGGWKPGEGNRTGRIGSLLLGVPDGRGLAYAGHVGTGFSAAVLRQLGEQLEPLRRTTSPFVDPVPREHARGAVWVEPRLVGEVAFGEWTRDGRLRHPTWRGLRPDKEPGDVRLES